MSTGDRRRQMKVGIQLPPAAPWPELRHMIEAAEDVGLDSIWVMDHLVFRVGHRTFPVSECWSLVAATAAVTADCVEIGRNPATLGRTAGIWIDLPGRVGRGMGAGSAICDSPEAIADALRGYAAAGMSHVQVWLDPFTVSSIARLASAVDLVDVRIATQTPG